jgi:TetR/AcrR family transcriptional regulator, transcriptional repressor for nem operon
MARPREFDTEEALDRATEVFWERGYEATSIQDLVDALGINRASLYATFGDKAKLFESVLQRYDAVVTSAVTKTLDPPASGRQAMAHYFAALIEHATSARGPRGCLALNTATGCSTAPPELLERVNAAIRSNTTRIQSALARDPALSDRPNLAGLARFLAAEGHGLIVLARTGIRRAQLEEAAQIALRVLGSS